MNGTALGRDPRNGRGRMLIDKLIAQALHNSINFKPICSYSTSVSSLLPSRGSLTVAIGPIELSRISTTGCHNIWNMPGTNVLNRVDARAKNQKCFHFK